MKGLPLLVCLVYFSSAKNGALMKQKYCKQLQECLTHENQTENTCGVRKTQGKHDFKVFTNKCELLQYGCQVEDYKNAYKIIKLKYCARKHIHKPPKSNPSTELNEPRQNIETQCDNIKCASHPDSAAVCAMSQHNHGFKVRRFINQCELHKYNCRFKRRFIETYGYICSTLYNSNETRQSPSDKLVLDEDEHIVEVPPLANSDSHVKANSHSAKHKINKKHCYDLQCSFEIANNIVCGIRQRTRVFKTKLFLNKCELWKYNCLNTLQFFETDLDLCSSLPISIKTMKIASPDKTSVVKSPSAAPTKLGIFVKASEPDGSIKINKTRCAEFNCSFEVNETAVCGIRQYGAGFKIRLFSNNCKLWKYNCHKTRIFFETDLYVCSSLRPSAEVNEAVIETATRDGDDEGSYDTPTNITAEGFEDANTEMNPFPSQSSSDKTRRRFPEKEKRPSKRNIVMIVNGSLFDFDGNPNHTIENFFKTTHTIPMPIRDVKPTMHKITRRALVKRMGPVIIYEPFTKKPAVVNTSFMYVPLLSSCYHKCPEKCPDIYSPVCGSRPTNTLLPGFMFKNHCYMDAASCYIHFHKYNVLDTIRINPLPTYIEATWLFCMGDTAATAMSRVLPAIRMLQHLGRIKKTSKFYYQFRNMRMFNELHRQRHNLFG